jgi:hypothetical protein
MHPGVQAWSSCRAPGSVHQIESCTPTGIDFPAAVVSELELHGYAIERVYDHEQLVGVRLLHPKQDTTDTPAARRRWWRLWK